MEKRLKISIITPCFNSGKYIEECIKSVANQNYPEIEHIIIDGGSNDNTLTVLGEYSHLTWVSEPDKGQSDALNKGFRKAAGDIVGWLNADDYYLAGTFERVCDAFEENPDADIIYGNWNFVDANSRNIKFFQTVPFNLKAVVYYGPYIGSTALFFRRSIIDQGIWIDERFKYAMDWEWYSRLGKLKKKFVFINETFAGFRIHGVNQSQKFRQMSEMDKFFTRARQLAEGYAIRRCYGHHWGDGEKSNIFEEISYHFLWWYYRLYIMAKKSYFLLKTKPSLLKTYISNRKLV